MVFDIVVFDPAVAPADRESTLRWLEFEGDSAHGDDRFASWMRTMQDSFPSEMRAPRAAAEGRPTARYWREGGRVLVSAPFEWAHELEAAVHRSAVAHGLGFWDCATEGSVIWRPPGEALSQLDHDGLTLTVDGQAPLVSPSDALIAAAVDWVGAGRGAGFLIVENGRGDYAQVAGGAEGLTAEWRLTVPDEAAGFWHGVAATGLDQGGGSVALSGAGHDFAVSPSERLQVADAREVVLAFANGRAVGDHLSWRDITAQLEQG